MALATPRPMEAGIPHPTLYLQNLNEKVRPEHVKETLKEWCAPFGQIKNVIVKKRLALRGQAWIQFDSTESASRALAFLQGRRLYRKSIVARYAKFKSYAVSKADGTFETEKYHRELEKAEKARHPRMTRRQIMTQVMANPAMAAMGAMPMTMQHGAGLPMGIGSDMQLPNKILFITSIPAGTSDDVLNKTFGKFPGFLEIRPVPGRPDLSFAEYESEQQAASARAMLDNHEFAPGARIRVSFARR